jgi:Mechanosensitive ion channel, conserved TM helix
MNGPITNWGAALMTSLAAALSLFLAAIPRIIGFIVILVVGWLISGVLGAAVGALLRAVKFNVLAQRSGLQEFIHNMGLRTDPAGLLAEIVKWFVRLIVMVVAFDALGLPAVSAVFQQFLLWIPNLVVAVVVLVITGLAANALGDLVRGSTAQAGFSNPDLLSTIARVAVWGFGIVVAVNQIGVAETLVNTLFMGFVGALALAAGLAFGLGGRETAAQIVQNWYNRGRANQPKMERATENIERQAQRNMPSTRGADD